MKKTKSNSLNLTPLFYTELEQVLTIKKNLIFLNENFNKDLKIVFENLKYKQEKIEDIDFEALGVVLNNLKKSTIKNIQYLLKDVSPSDPIFCPISLFGSMDYGRIETAHTRTLAWLINPRSQHGFKHILLRELIKKKFDHLITDDFSVGSEVSCYSADKSIYDGRIDVFAESQSGKWALVIEAKIDAEESENQLSDYDYWLNEKYKKNGYKTMRIFLTTDGSESSTSKAEEWVPCSYMEIAKIFNDASIENKFFETQKETFPFLRYYICGLLSELSGISLPINLMDLDKNSNIYELQKYLLRK